MLPLALTIPEDSIFWPILRVAIVLLFILMIVPGIIYWERKLLAWFQDRVGPNRVGPFGLLQTIADGIKLFLKEDVNPAGVDKFIYLIAPAVALLPAFAIWGTIPWGPNPLLTPIADVDIGILYVLAVSSMGVYGVFLAGWASNNKYSLLGGLRAAAQMVSYEIPLTLSIVGAVVLAGTLSFSELIVWQREHGWLLFWQPIGLGIFYISSLAEVNRTPFDMVEADSELVAGPYTEYSGMRFGFFFFAEYVALFIMSGILVSLFFGGWLAPWPFPAQLDGFAGTLYGIFWFFLKTYTFVFIAVWLRATLPRVRVDQLMGMAWKVLLPLALVNLFVTAIAVVVFDL